MQVSFALIGTLLRLVEISDLRSCHYGSRSSSNSPWYRMNKPKAGDSLPSCKKERERGHTSNIVLFQTSLAVCMAAFHCVRHSVRKGRREGNNLQCQQTISGRLSVSRERSAAHAYLIISESHCLACLVCHVSDLRFLSPFPQRPTSDNNQRPD